MRPLISPDGNMLVYATRFETETGLRIRDLKNGEEHWLKYPVQRDDQESVFSRDFLPTYAFTPDGKEVVAAWGGKIHRISVATGQDSEIPFTAKVSRDIGPDLNLAMRVEEGPVQLRLMQQPAQSPDGKRLAFSALTHIYLMDLPAGTPKRLSTGAASRISASLVAGRTVDRLRHLGTKRRTNMEDARRWAGNSATTYDHACLLSRCRLVAGRETDCCAACTASSAPWKQFDEWDHTTANLELIWLPSDGGDVNLILPARGAANPHFGPEPDRIYLYSDADLISLRYDGTDRRTIIKVVGKTWFR